MESGCKKIVMEIEKNSKKSNDISTSTRSFDNSISIMYRPTVHSDLVMGVFRFIFFIQNHNVMQEANHLCHSVFSV